jgi:hypothetical protein
MRNWLFQRAHRPIDIPLAIVRSAVSGVLCGPFVGSFFHWLFQGSWEDILAHPFHFAFDASRIGAVFSVTFYLTCGMPWIFLRTVITKLPAWSRWPFGIAVSALGGSLGAVIAIRSTEVLVGIHTVPPEFFTRMLAIDSVLAVIIGMFMGVYHHMWQEAQIRERKLAATAANAQAYALQAQIAPHFFFNALNSISALIPVDPKGAQQMIGQLAEIFRYIFSSSREELVPLHREITFVREYLTLEKIRYRERLQYELPSGETMADLRLPGLTLQPIVENAIRHGIAKRLNGGIIRIEVEPVSTGWCITVSNQYDAGEGPPDLTDKALFRPRHALENVRERLKLAFGEPAGIVFARDGVDWVRATLTIPRGGEIAHARISGG